MGILSLRASARKRGVSPSLREQRCSGSPPPGVSTKRQALRTHVNSIVNKMAISYDTNRHIGGKAPIYECERKLIERVTAGGSSMRPHPFPVAGRLRSNDYETTTPVSFATLWCSQGHGHRICVNPSTNWRDGVALRPTLTGCCCPSAFAPSSGSLTMVWNPSNRSRHLGSL